MLNSSRSREVGGFKRRFEHRKKKKKKMGKKPKNNTKWEKQKNKNLTKIFEQGKV